MRRQTITPVLGEQKLYQRPDALLLWPSPCLALLTHRPALLELQAQMQFCLSIPPPPEGASLDSPPISPCLPVTCVLLSTDHYLKQPPCHLRDLSVLGDVMSSVKEGPSCPHALSAEFPPQIPITTAWKASPDGCGAGARWGPRGWVPWAAPVVRVDRDLPAVARTGQQADQLLRGRGSHCCSGSWLPRKGCQFHSPEHPVSCYTFYLCDFNSLGQNALDYTLGRIDWTGFSSVQSLSRV